MGLVSRVVAPVAARIRRHRAWSRLALACVPDLRRRIDVPQVGPFYIRLRTNRSYWLRHPLGLERFPLGALRAMARPDDVAWDVGANIGLYSRYLAGPCGISRVVAFEPMSGNRPQLQANLELGGCTDRVTVLPWALSDEQGEEDLQIDDIQSATAVLSRVTGGAPSEGRAAVGLKPRTERVTVRTLDGIVAEAQAPAPTLMKVDVEGAEASVLRGARDHLTRHDVRLVVELHGVAYARQTVELLWELGYHVRGRAGDRIEPAGYVDVDASLLDRMEYRSDLGVIVAARRADDLPVTDPSLQIG